MINNNANVDSSSPRVLRKESQERRSAFVNSARSTQHAARFLYIACFTFLSFRLLASLMGTAYANSVTDDGKKLSPDSSNTKIPKNINGLQLLKANISIAESENDTKSKEQLRRIIEQIRSVEFKPQEQAPEPVIKPEKAPVIEPNETVPEVNVPKQEQPQKRIESKPPYEPITDQTLQMLRTLAQNPQKLENPLELGEIVFASGNLKEASICYREALRRKDPNDTGSADDRAWVMFQIGNCLRNAEPPAAAKAYQQLITEYPNSPWTQPAKVRNDLIAWYLKDKPAELMKQVKSTPVEQDNVGPHFAKRSQNGNPVK